MEGQCTLALMHARTHTHMQKQKKKGTNEQWKEQTKKRTNK